MKDHTRASHAGRPPITERTVVNPPVWRGSTVLYPTVADMRAAGGERRGDGLSYGTHGLPTAFALEDAIRALEGGYRTRLQNSGLVACTLPLLACLSSGDHLLMTDSVYGPTREFCDGMLKRMGVETQYYDPMIGGGIRDLIRPNTKVVFVESPGSWTFEVQDIPAIAAEARAAGALTIMDNTWASPLYFKPFEHGVDISIQAVTKYIAGHSDLLMGSVTATEEAYPLIQQAQAQLGACASGDDCALALRGLRTLPTRLPRHWESGVQVAEWLAAQPEVLAVMHPARPEDSGHALWRRDFRGASGLFGFILRPELKADAALSALLDDLQLHGMGYSWGGYESLLIPTNPRPIRTAAAWPNRDLPEGQTMRIHVGLEDPDDLIADLSDGFARMRRAAA